ncbi:hypothetical protein BBD39_10560 [Arsenophonus endosymbiont of Bemisia tabaci Asia II 3]|nr:hypothetical protein BBD39_10560 [Arsenophonus endosymbiont of Bemisia tabaci Asia II 3]
MLVLEEMTGQDGLYVNEKDAVEVCFQVVRVQRFGQQFPLRSLTIEDKQIDTICLALHESVRVMKSEAIRFFCFS